MYSMYSSSSSVYFSVQVKQIKSKQNLKTIKILCNTNKNVISVIILNYPILAPYCVFTIRFVKIAGEHLQPCLSFP